MYKFELQTARLLLREFRLEDAAGFFAMNNDRLVMKYTGDAPFVSVEAAADFILNYDHYHCYGYGRWTIRRRTDGVYLGFCGLRYDSTTGEVDLGYRLVRKYWGEGYATEAARACLDYGFRSLQLPRIIGRATRENTASIHVLKKIGMTFDHHFDFDGQPGVLYVTHQENA